MTFTYKTCFSCQYPSKHTHHLQIVYDNNIYHLIMISIILRIIVHLLDDIHSLSTLCILILQSDGICTGSLFHHRNLVHYEMELD